MITHDQVSSVNSRLRSGRALGLIAAALTLLGAHSASATGPTLFTGIEKQSGGILQTPNLITTSPTFYGYYGAGGAGTAQVTSAGGFAVYANQFSTTFSYTFIILPIYPYIRIEKTVMNDAGTFGNSYFVPSVPVSVPTAMGYPTLPGTKRDGYIRVVPGPKGFGGQVRWNITKVYTFDYVSSLGTLHLSIHPDHDPAGNFDHGGSPLGAQGPTNNPCCQSYPLGYPPHRVPAVCLLGCACYDPGALAHRHADDRSTPRCGLHYHDPNRGRRAKRAVSNRCHFDGDTAEPVRLAERWRGEPAQLAKQFWGDSRAGAHLPARAGPARHAGERDLWPAGSAVLPTQASLSVLSTRSILSPRGWTGPSPGRSVSRRSEDAQLGA